MNVSEWVCTYVSGSRATHCQFFLDSQRTFAAKQKSRDVFCCPSLCSVTLNVRCILKWHSALVFLLSSFCHLETLYLLLTQTNTHLFYAHQQWRIPKSTSLNNGHKETSSMHHQCRAFSHIAVYGVFVLSSSVLLKQTSSWVLCLPVFSLSPVWTSCHQLDFAGMCFKGAGDGQNDRNINHNVLPSRRSPVINTTLWNL